MAFKLPEGCSRKEISGLDRALDEVGSRACLTTVIADLITSGANLSHCLTWAPPRNLKFSVR
jgi:hypothetical protein